MSDQVPIKSPNDGQIIAIKDNFVTRDLPATCASDILDGFSAEDATVIKLLKEAGMATVVKTNMDEFGMGSHSTNSAYGAVRTTLGREALSAGGSSGGSALAVASGLVDCALGSDTGGSVRLPAAYTGIVGFKPSYGIISRKGLIPYANSLDTVGLFGNSCLDIWILYRILAQYDPEDPTSLSPNSRKRIEEAREARRSRNSIFSFNSYESSKRRDLKVRSHNHFRNPASSLFLPATTTRRIGVPIEYNIAEMHSSVRAAWVRTLSNLQYLGHEIIPISLPSTQKALSAYYVLAPAEASSNLAKYDGVRYGRLRDPNHVDDANGTLYSAYRGAFFGEEVKRRILLGSFTLSAGAMDNYFIQAQKVRRTVQADFDLVFRMRNPMLISPPSSSSSLSASASSTYTTTRNLPKTSSIPNPEGIDYIICPTAPTPPPKLIELNSSSPLDNYINDVFTVPASLAGLPAISVPAQRDVRDGSGLDRSIGMQVIGQFGDDIGVIQFARRWLDQDWGGGIGNLGGVGAAATKGKKGSSLGKRPKFT